MTVEFLLLGPVEARRAGQVLDLGPPRRRAVLVALLADVTTVVSVDQLVYRVWSDHPPLRARDTLHSYLSRLRSAGIDIRRRSGGYTLVAEEEAVDLHRFRRLVGRARATDRVEAAAELLGQALNLWRGQPFGELDSPWLAGLRGPLERERMAAELDYADLRLRLGRHAELVTELPARIAMNPADERLAGQFMLALYRCGRQAEALAHYERLRLRLADELGADPSPPLRRLHQRILTAAPVLDAPAAHRQEIPTPRQLPPAPRHFVGRDTELAQLTAVLTGPQAGQPAVITGTGGVGKTWLALHWAHRHAERFPDGQLFVDLQGFSADGQPMDPATAVRGFLDALGVDAESIPVSAHAQSALFRSIVAGRRLLVVVDNARSADQVVPLLTGSPGCTVVVTSRDRLSELVARHCASPVLVDAFTETEAHQVLSGRIGAERVAAEPAAVRELLTSCAGFPLALGIVAGRAASRPDFSLADLAAELRDAGTRMDVLDDDNPAVSFPCVLSWSRDTLTPAQARAFALLGWAPGPDIGLAAATTLVDLPTSATRSALRALENVHLVQQRRPGRWAMHDLVRLYASDGTRQHEHEQALHRLLIWYLHTAEAARTVFDPHRVRIIDLEPLPSGCVVPQFRDYENALAWYETERANLRAAVLAAVPLGLPAVAWQLAWVLLSFYYRRSHWPDWVTVYQVALDATRALGETRGEGIIWRGLGVVYSDLHEFDTAVECHRRAQAIFEEIGDLHGQAWNLNNLGVVHVEMNAITDSANCFQRALALFRKTGDRQGEAISLNNLGDAERLRGRPAAAVECLTGALDIQRNRDDQAGLQFTLHTLGDLYRGTGKPETAVTHYEQALAISRHLNDDRSAARTLSHLAEALYTLGNIGMANHYWRMARSISTELGIREHTVPVQDAVVAK
ncbi:BTAD domain-containing putative transcriptional regulator [Amycolatopsis sp. NPDC005003]